MVALDSHVSHMNPVTERSLVRFLKLQTLSSPQVRCKVGGGHYRHLSSYRNQATYRLCQGQVSIGINTISKFQSSKTINRQQQQHVEQTI